MARGDFDAALQLLERMVSRLHKLGEQHLANPEYATSYVERFLAKPVRSRRRGAYWRPNKLVQGASGKVAVHLRRGG